MLCSSGWDVICKQESRLFYVGTRILIKMYYKYQTSFVYHYKPLVLKIEIDLNVIMWYHEQMSFDLPAHFYSRGDCST